MQSGVSISKKLYTHVCAYLYCESCVATTIEIYFFNSVCECISFEESFANTNKVIISTVFGDAFHCKNNFTDTIEI